MAKFFTLPDFAGRCPYPLYKNANYQASARISEEWLDSYDIHPNDAHRNSFRNCDFGLLTAMCYSEAHADRFRILCDFINCLFAFDDLTDEGGLRKDVNGTSKASGIVMDVLRQPHSCETPFKIGQVIKDFWRRAVDMDCCEGTKRRFLESTELYLKAVTRQVQQRADESTISVENFIELRRDTGALKMCFAMGEFGLGVDIPDEVFQDPSMMIMQDCANDVVVLSNDIYSYNIEQAQDDKCNIIETVMMQENLPLQGAMDFAGDLVYNRIKKFEEAREKLPSWGTKVDGDVEKYIRVMVDWMTGGFHWSLESKRYFGENVAEVKKTLCVGILPKETPRGDTAIAGLQQAQSPAVLIHSVV